MTRVGPLAIVCVLLSSCAQPPDNPERREQAAQLAGQFLHAVAGPEGDRGWSLLHPSRREEWGSERAYVEAVTEADWSRFEFEVFDATFCDDGLWCSVRVEFPGGPESVPELLRSSDGRQTDGLVFQEVPGLPGNAQMSVVLDGFMSSAGAGVLPDPG